MLQSAELQSSMLSPRTAKYVEALVLEGDDFDYFKWLRRVREEEAQAKQIPVVVSSSESPAFEIGDLTNTPDGLDAPGNSEPAIQAKLAPTIQERCTDQITKPKGKVRKIGLGED